MAGQLDASVRELRKAVQFLKNGELPETEHFRFYCGWC